MTTSNRRAVRAFTLTELAIVLAVIGVILGAMWAVASTVFVKSEQRQAMQQIMTVVENMRSFYGISGASPGGVGSDVTGAVNARRLIPVTMRLSPTDDTGTVLNHAMASSSSGTFKIIAATSTEFRIELQNLTKKNCVDLLMSFPFLVPELGVRRIAASGNTMTVDMTNASTINTNLPFSLPRAMNWCSTTSNTIDIDFSYRG